MEITGDLIKALQDGVDGNTAVTEESQIVLTGQLLGALYAEALTAVLQAVKATADRQADIHGMGGMA